MLGSRLLTRIAFNWETRNAWALINEFGDKVDVFVPQEVGDVHGILVVKLEALSLTRSLFVMLREAIAAPVGAGPLSRGGIGGVGGLLRFITEDHLLNNCSESASDCDGVRMNVTRRLFS